MNEEQLLKELKDLLAEGKIKKVIDFIRENSDGLHPVKQNQIDLIYFEFLNLRRANRKDIINHKEYRTEHYKISKALTSFVSDLKDDDLQILSYRGVMMTPKGPLPPNDPTPSKSSWRNLLYFMSSGLFILTIYLIGTPIWILALIILLIISYFVIAIYKLKRLNSKFILRNKNYLKIGEVSGLNNSITFISNPSTTPTQLINIKIDKDFDQFKHADALEVISRIESLIEKENVKLKSIERGSTILKLKLDYEDALLLMKLIQEGKLDDLGVSSASVEEFVKNPELYNMVYSAAMLASPPVKKKKVKPFKLRPFIRKMKNTLTTDIPQVLLKVKAKIKEDSPKFNQIIQITGSYDHLKNQVIANVNDRAYSDLKRSQITNNLLNLLDSLTIEDIDKD